MANGKRAANLLNNIKENMAKLQKNSRDLLKIPSYSKVSKQTESKDRVAETLTSNISDGLNKVKKNKFTYTPISFSLPTGNIEVKTEINDNDTTVSEKRNLQNRTGKVSDLNSTNNFSKGFSKMVVTHKFTNTPIIFHLAIGKREVPTEVNNNDSMTPKVKKLQSRTNMPLDVNVLKKSSSVMNKIKGSSKFISTPVMFNTTTGKKGTNNNGTTETKSNISEKIAMKPISAFDDSKRKVRSTETHNATAKSTTQGSGCNKGEILYEIKETTVDFEVKSQSEDTTENELETIKEISYQTHESTMDYQVKNQGTANDNVPEEPIKLHKKDASLQNVNGAANYDQGELNFTPYRPEENLLLLLANEKKQINNSNTPTYKNISVTPMKSVTSNQCHTNYAGSANLEDEDINEEDKEESLFKIAATISELEHKNHAESGDNSFHEEVIVLYDEEDDLQNVTEQTTNIQNASQAQHYMPENFYRKISSLEISAAHDIYEDKSVEDAINHSMNGNDNYNEHDILLRDATSQRNYDRNNLLQKPYLPGIPGEMNYIFFENKKYLTSKYLNDWFEVIPGGTFETNDESDEDFSNEPVLQVDEFEDDFVEESNKPLFVESSKDLFYKGSFEEGNFSEISTSEMKNNADEDISEIMSPVLLNVMQDASEGILNASLATKMDNALQQVFKLLQTVSKGDYRKLLELFPEENSKQTTNKSTELESNIENKVRVKRHSVDNDKSRIETNHQNSRSVITVLIPIPDSITSNTQINHQLTSNQHGYIYVSTQPPVSFTPSQDGSELESEDFEDTSKLRLKSTRFIIPQLMTRKIGKSAENVYKILRRATNTSTSEDSKDTQRPLTLKTLLKIGKPDNPM